MSPLIHIRLLCSETARMTCLQRAITAELTTMLANWPADFEIDGSILPRGSDQIRISAHLVRRGYIHDSFMRDVDQGTPNLATIAARAVAIKFADFVD